MTINGKQRIRFYLSLVLICVPTFVNLFCFWLFSVYLWNFLCFREEVEVENSPSQLSESESSYPIVFISFSCCNISIERKSTRHRYCFKRKRIVANAEEEESKAKIVAKLRRNCLLVECKWEIILQHCRLKPKKISIEHEMSKKKRKRFCSLRSGVVVGIERCRLREKK